MHILRGGGRVEKAEKTYPDAAEIEAVKQQALERCVTPHSCGGSPCVALPSPYQGSYKPLHIMSKRQHPQR